MADVHVTTTNPEGQSATFRMDEEDERIAHFRVMARRGELDGVEVKEAPAPKPSRK